MIRRFTIPLVALAATAVLTGCGTLDDDVVASVNGVELGADEFGDRYDEVGESLDPQTADLLLGDLPDGRQQADLARSLIADFIHTELLREAGVLDFYAAGPDASGVVCIELAAVADLGQAEAAVDELQGGATWADVTADTAQRNEGCAPVSGLGELAVQLAGVSGDDPYRSLVFPGGEAYVVRLQDGDEANPVQLVQFVSAVDGSFVEPLAVVTDAADISIDPQYGAYNRDVVWFLGGDEPVVQPLG